MFYVFLYQIIKINISKDEDYEKFHEKYNKNIWEALCSNCDPKFVEEIEAAYKTIEDNYEGMIFLFLYNLN
jgi:hypothetical protein